MSQLHLVLDHSAFIPCGDKPEEEKEAIRRLGGALSELNIVWYVSRSYLRTLYTVCSRELKHHHPLPRFQASLMRISERLLELASTKTWLCRSRALRGSVEAEVSSKLRLHVVARTALKHIDPELREELESLENLSSEELEVLALAIMGSRYARPIHVVATDEPLLRAAARLSRSVKLEVRALAPRQLVEQLATE